MCGRFAETATQLELVSEFGVVQVTGEIVGPRWNIAPTDPVAVICQRPSDDGPVRTLQSMRWGLVPSWSAGPRTMGSPLINARAETVAEKPTWRRPFERQRCLIPADGYYEWLSVGRGKQPYYLNEPERRLAFAGVYDFWRDEKLPVEDPTAWMASCAIITARASDDLGYVHHRMPVVLDADRYQDWLTESGVAQQVLASATRRLAGRLRATKVAPLVNKVGNEGPGLVAPLGE